MTKGLKLGIGILLSLLFLTAALIFSGRRDQAAFPSATSRRPSGLGAFAQLLERDGYKVTVDRKERFASEPGDIVIAIELDFPPMPDDFSKQIRDHLAGGGDALLLSMPQDFDEASRRGEDTSTYSLALNEEEQRLVNLGFDYPVFPPDWANPDIGTAVWEENGEPAVRMGSEGAGTVAFVRDGLGATNRFLDQHDNAVVMLSTVRAVAEPGSRIIFAEASFGNTARDGLFSALGAGASAARWQALLLFLVIIFSLSRRFGPPIFEESKERGARDMLSAFAQTMASGKKAGFAASALQREAIERIRKVRRMPRSANRKEVLSGLPSELKEAISSLSTREDISANEAVRRTAHAERMLAQYETDSRDESRHS